MRNTAFINVPYEFIYNLADVFVYHFINRYFLPCISQKNMESPVLQFQSFLQRVFLQAPGFPYQALDPVPVNRPFEIPGTNSNAKPQFVLIYRSIDHPERRNVKTPPFCKKLLNGFPAFESLPLSQCEFFCHRPEVI